MPIAPSNLVHVVYRTRRFAEILAWYATVFGARIQYQNPALAFLTLGDEHHRFAFADLGVIRPDQSDADDRGLIGVDHVAWEYGSLRDLLENYAELKAGSIAPYWAVHHGMSAALYYADPDGNQMDENPVGVEYDPDDWLDRLRGGVAETELLKMDPAGEVSPIRGAMMGTEA